MYASFFHGDHVPIAHMFRNAAAATGAALVASWCGLLVLEVMRSLDWIPNIHSYTQALVLAGIFAAYAIGWRHALIGAILVFVGTAVFFAVGYAGVGILPPLPAAWFAAPGVLYLLAWTCGDGRYAHSSRT